MKSIDIKSLLIGILGTALVMVLMGSTFPSKGKYSVACVGEWYTSCLLTNVETGVTKRFEPEDEDVEGRISLGNKPDF